MLAQAKDLDWPPRAWTAEARALIDAAVPAALHVPPDPPGHHDAGIHPLHVFDALVGVVDRRAARPTTFVLDGGEFGQWARARLRLQPPQHLVNEPSGTIGFSVPFAIGARAVRPDATIVAVAGDGAFGFYAMEIETAVRHQLPFLVVVGNDAAWSTERHLQLGRYGRAVATDLTPARYDRLAAALGAHGEHVARLPDLQPALDRALQAVGAGIPAVVDVRIRSVPSPAGEPPA
jgi:acetolactate synthase-1/2/3 large subunit